MAARQPAGTSDTSRFATDHINNPNAINTIFNLSARPTEPERQRDGSMLPVHHILKDGADSIGVAGASLRVYVNIGMCGEYWVTRQDPVMGIARRQQPFEIDYARKNCEDWRRTEARMANAENFLKLMKPLLLKDAPGGAAALDRVSRHAQDRPSSIRGELRAVPLEQAAARGHRRCRCSGSAPRSRVPTS